MLFRKRRVKIDPELYHRLAEVAAQAGYANTEEFILHTLEQAADSGQNQSDQQIKDQQVIDQQLRGLGYLK